MFGQLVVIALIQLGGLGLVLFATLFSVVMRKKIDLQSRLNIQASLNQNELDGVVHMSLRIAKYTAAIETFFGTVLALRFSLSMDGRESTSATGMPFLPSAMPASICLVITRA